MFLKNQMFCKVQVQNKRMIWGRISFTLKYPCGLAYFPKSLCHYNQSIKPTLLHVYVGCSLCHTTPHTYVNNNLICYTQVKSYLCRRQSTKKSESQNNNLAAVIYQPAVKKIFKKVKTIIQLLYYVISDISLCKLTSQLREAGD